MDDHTVQLTTEFCELAFNVAENEGYANALTALTNALVNVALHSGLDHRAIVLTVGRCALMIEQCKEGVTPSEAALIAERTYPDPDDSPTTQEDSHHDNRS